LRNLRRPIKSCIDRYYDDDDDNNNNRVTFTIMWEVKSER